MEHSPGLEHRSLRISIENVSEEKVDVVRRKPIMRRAEKDMTESLLLPRVCDIIVLVISEVRRKRFIRNTLTTEGEILCGVLRCHINITAKKLAVLCLDGKVWRFYEEVSKNTVS
ncbi:hypothetical protein Y032_0007g3419 [Ancylostoma ceylanicum]|nr:hypothetical protein Y032_0007g3419 [Ancylostoma ceylanicum]